MYEKQIAFAHRLIQEKPALTIEFIADLHQQFPWLNKHLHECLEDMYERQIKHVGILGDITNNNFSFQWSACLNTLKEFPMQYYIPLGNHDVYSLKEKQLHIHPLYKELVLKTSSTLYMERNIKDITILILNPQTSEKTTAMFLPDQIEWLTNKVKQPRTYPLLILAHHPLSKTHKHSDIFENSLGKQSGELKEILNRYPNTIYCSAHIHNSYSLPNVQFDDTTCFLNIPSFTNIKYGIKRNYIGYHLEIYHDFIYIKTRDYAIHEWITSNEWIVDFKKNRVYAFDQDFLEDKAVQQRSKQS